MKTINYYLLFSLLIPINYALSDDLDYPDTPNLDRNFSSTHARIDSYVSPENRNPEVENGTVLTDEYGNLIVLDNIDDPECIFYGTHVSGYADQEIDSNIYIDSLNLNCN